MLKAHVHVCITRQPEIPYSIQDLSPNNIGTFLVRIIGLVQVLEIQFIQVSRSGSRIQIGISLAWHDIRRP